jgi:hypothetical protein
VSERERNRERMPLTAALVDEYRRIFGADQVRVRYASENGFEVGTPSEKGEVRDAA